MRPARRLTALAVVLALTALPAASSDLKDLFFGEALYHAFQGRYFEALQRLDTELGMHHGLDEPERDTLHYHINDAEYSVGDFELRYRMHQRAGRALKTVLDGAVDDAVRNEAAYRLARIHFQKGQFEDALSALARIRGPVPEEIRHDIEFLRANIYLATSRAHEAVEILEHVRSDESLAGFVAYNLGIALLQDGRPHEAIEQLSKAGQFAASDPARLAIRDKSNMVLGNILFEAGEFEQANLVLERGQIDGPFSNQVLLLAGLSQASAKHHERALVLWSTLADREPMDVAVQEAALAIPQAYAGLNLHGRAAVAYGRALELFDGQIERIDASIRSIVEGRFLKALSREEMRQDEGWIIRLRSLPDAPETYYLMELTASNDFHTALQNYLDLEELRLRLIESETSLAAFDDIVRLRRLNYEPLLPQVDAEFSESNVRMRLRFDEQKQLERQLKSMLTSPRPEYLATTDERAVAASLGLIEAQLGTSDLPEMDALRRRAARLRGVLTWRLETEYQERFARAHANFNEAKADLDALARQYDAFVRSRQAATHGYSGYDVQISRLRERVAEALQHVETLIARQGKMIEASAIEQLEARRQRLVQQQSQARFGAADSYDRAARAQSLPEKE